MHNAKTVKLISQWTEVGKILICNCDAKGDFYLLVPDIITLLHFWASVSLPSRGQFPQMMLLGHQGPVGRVLDTLSTNGGILSIDPHFQPGGSSSSYAKYSWIAKGRNVFGGFPLLKNLSCLHKEWTWMSPN